MISVTSVVKNSSRKSKISSYSDTDSDRKEQKMSPQKSQKEKSWNLVSRHSANSAGSKIRQAIEARLSSLGKLANTLSFFALCMLTARRNLLRNGGILLTVVRISRMENCFIRDIRVIRG